MSSSPSQFPRRNRGPSAGRLSPGAGGAPVMWNTVSVTADRASIDGAVRAILDQLHALGYSEASRFAIRLAIEEAIANAFRHGHRSLPGDTPVRLSSSLGPGEVHLAVEDSGPGFKPDAVPDPTLDENLELPSGRGLMLMRAYMTRVAYNAAGNRVEMTYVKPQTRPGGK